MDREMAFALLVLLVCGPTLWLSGAPPGRDWMATGGGGRRLERLSWMAIWLRLLPTGTAFAALAGWAVQEPEPSDESLRPVVLLILIPVAIVWTRAAIRAAVAASSPRAALRAATIGLLRPRIVIAPEVVQGLDPAALRALRQHEEAHVRHRDPLRIWLAQFATDLQWPWPSPRARFRSWLHAVELARDEEARRRGAIGTDLAAAVLCVAEMTIRNRSEGVHARLTGDGEMLEARVKQLLSPVPPSLPLSKNESRLFAVMIASLLLAAFLLGLRYGDAVIQALPGVARELPTVARLARALVV